jgi:N-acetyl-anhydromuramyl-L-alanine amidase AmpD
MPAVAVPFNETNLINGWPNCQSRNGQKPRYFVLHTSEGAGGMDLVNYMRGAQVSYHYVVDNNGDVFDLVDTNDSSWSCLDWNGFTINAVFGASHAGWSRQQWIDNMGVGIRNMAYLCAQDCLKYGIPIDVSLTHPYRTINTGVIDHHYITVVGGIGSHVDVGDNFPTDLFIAQLQTFYSQMKGSPVPAPFQYPSTDQMVRQIWEQLFGPQAKGWPQLGNRTLIDAVADIEKRIK